MNSHSVKHMCCEREEREAELRARVAAFVKDNVDPDTTTLTKLEEIVTKTMSLINNTFED